ncbi:MAG: HAMP domain-containing histidine kinase [Candidatus Lokiarchaeota archaeon]|nr:HAMP domain-containing histidine kinase [Candidatus Harpocratesius repetitus]
MAHPLQSPNDLFLRMFESEKFLLMGKMASGVAHEINNPIMIIQNYVSLILDEITEHGHLDIAPNNDYYSALQEIMEECKRISKITKNLLEFTRSKSNIPEKADLENILLKVIKLMQPMIVRAQIKLNIKINIANSQCIVRSDQIQQVFVNLIDNSIFALQKKYPGNSHSSNEKFIEISIYHKEINQNGQSKSFIAIEFYDDGIGIEKNLQSQLFKPFVTTKKSKANQLESEKYQGLGLGLAYCKDIIQNHKGFIEFESEPNKFARFIIYLPLNDENSKSKIESSVKHVPKSNIVGNGEENDDTIIF